MPTAPNVAIVLSCCDRLISSPSSRVGGGSLPHREFYQKHSWSPRLDRALVAGSLPGVGWKQTLGQRTCLPPPRGRNGWPFGGQAHEECGSRHPPYSGACLPPP